MGIGLRWISVALEAFDFELAAMVADGVIDKIEDVVESKKMKTKHKQGMLTETELTSVIDNGELLIINNYEVDTISIYTSNNSSFNILGRDGTNRYTIKGKNKLREIQFHTRLKKDSNGKKQNKEIGIVEQKRSSREKLSIVLLDNLLTDIWINDEKNICFSDSQWMIIKYEESFSYSICLNGTELATVTIVINDCDNAIKGYKHALKLYHDDCDYECVLLFVAVTLLENSHLFNEPLMLLRSYCIRLIVLQRYALNRVEFYLECRSFCKVF
jgi:hypothetical protein